MSEIREAGSVQIELHEVRLTEHVAPCEVGSSDIFTKNKQSTGLQLWFCGEFIVFERPGFMPEAVSATLIKKMVSLKDATASVEEKKLLAVQRAEAEKLAKAAELEKRRLAAEAEMSAKKAEMAAKLANPNFSNTTFEESDEVPEAVAVPVPPPVEEKELLAEMGRGRGNAVSDEEERSMKAAVARANRGRR